MSLIEDYDMIKQLAVQRTNYLFHIGILPRRCGSRDDLLYPKAFDPSRNLPGEKLEKICGKVAF